MTGCPDCPSTRKKWDQFDNYQLHQIATRLGRQPGQNVCREELLLFIEEAEEERRKLTAFRPIIGSCVIRRRPTLDLPFVNLIPKGPRA